MPNLLSFATSLMNKQIADEERQREKIALEKEKLMNNPSLVDKMTAQFQRGYVPDERLAKLPTEANLARVEKNIPEGDPRKGVGSIVAKTFNQILPSIPEDVSPSDVLRELNTRFHSAVKEDVYRYKQKEESSFPGFVTHPKIENEAEYQQWKQEFEGEKTPFEFEPGKNLAMAGAWEAGVVGVRKLMGKKLVGELATKLFPKIIGAGGPVGIALSVGLEALMALPAFEAFDVGSWALQRTSWGKQRPYKSEALSLVASGVVAHQIMKRVGGFLEGLTKIESKLTESGAKTIASPTGSNVLEYTGFAKTAKDHLDEFGELINKRIAEGKININDMVGKINKDEANLILEELKAGVSQGTAINKVLKIANKRIKTEEIGKVATAISKIREKKLSLLEDRVKAEYILNGEGPIEQRLAKAKEAQEALDRMKYPERWHGKQPEINKVLYDKLIEKGYSDETIKLIPQHMRKKLIERTGLTYIETTSKAMENVRTKIRAVFETKLPEVKIRNAIGERIIPAQWTGGVKPPITSKVEIPMSEKSTIDISETKKQLDKASQEAHLLKIKRAYAIKQHGMGSKKEVEYTAQSEVKLQEIAVLQSKLQEVPPAIKPVISKPIIESMPKESPRLTPEQVQEYVSKETEAVTLSEKNLQQHFVYQVETKGGREHATNLLKTQLENATGQNVEENAMLLQAGQHVLDNYPITEGKVIEGVRKAHVDFLNRLRKNIKEIDEIIGEEVLNDTKVITGNDIPIEFKVKEDFETPIEQSIDNIANKVLGKGERLNLIKERTRSLRNKGIIATAILVPVSTLFDDLFGGKEAEAGIASTAGELVVKPLVDFAKGAFKDAKDLKEFYKYIKEAGLLSEGMEEGATSLPKKMNSIVLPPNLTHIIRTKPVRFLDWMSLHGASEMIYGGTDKTGNAMLTLPSVQLASAVTTAEQEAMKFQMATKNIMEEAGIKSARKEVENAMLPHQKATEVLSARASYLYGQAKELEKSFNKLVKQSTKETGNTKRATEILSDTIADDQLKALNELEDLRKQLKDYSPNIDATYKDLAKQHPSVRVALAAEDIGMVGEDQWLRPLMNEKELIATTKVKGLYEEYLLRMIDAGQDPILESAYIHHASHPERDLGAIKEGLKIYKQDPKFSYPLAQFHSRQVWSKQMMPDVEYIAQRYAPDAAKRIEFGHFWNGGWRDHVNQLKQLGWKAPLDFWAKVEEGMKPVEETIANSVARKMYAFEMMRYIGFSPSVAFKHGLKLEANWSLFGIKHSAKFVPESIRVFNRNTVEDIYKMATGKLLPNDYKADMVRQFTSINRMTQHLADLTDADIPDKFIDKWLTQFNKVGSVLVSGVERFDRGHSALAAMEMAYKKGMTPAQAVYGVYDTILRTNFLSGIQNPKWLRDPKVRLMMMFQGTPFKIWEQRYLMARRTGQALGKTKDVFWEQMQNLRKDVKEGESRFKYHLIMDTLGSERDIFGTPVALQMMRKLLIVGSIISTGRMAFDMDLWDHFAHPPFIKLHEKSIELGTNPLISAGLEAWGRRNEEDRDFVTTEFFRTWLKGGGLPIIANKLYRLTKDDIPERYRDSKFKYFLGVPAYKGED